MKQITVHNPAKLQTISHKELKDFQGDLKISRKPALKKLMNSIIKHGIFIPKFVWFENNEALIIDGHQTRKALELLEEDGYTVPPIPYVEVKAKSRKDAAEKLILINSRYGDINPETSFFGNYEFNTDEIKELLEEFEIPELNLDALLDDGAQPGSDDSFEQPPATVFQIIVDFDDEHEQDKLLEELIRRGLKCRALII